MSEKQRQWKHLKRGTVYTEIGRAELQLSDNTYIGEGAKLVIYRGEDGKLWAREIMEFEDGRFEEIENIDKTIGDTITSLAKRFDNELYILTEDELRKELYYKWDNRYNVHWNLYLFSDMLEMYKRSCRRWEEHHNGHECVVERVRDKYIMPRIKEFFNELVNQSYQK